MRGWLLEVSLSADVGESIKLETYGMHVNSLVSFLPLGHIERFDSLIALMLQSKEDIRVRLSSFSSPRHHRIVIMGKI